MIQCSCVPMSFPLPKIFFYPTLFISVPYSRSVMSDSLWPHGLQHSRLPCPLPTPRAYSNSCPSSQCYHPTISSSIIPFSSCLQSFSASGSFLVSQFFTSGGQCIGVSSFSISPSNECSGLISFRTDWFDLLGDSPTLQFKSINSSVLSLLCGPTLISIRDYWKNHSFD